MPGTSVLIRTGRATDPDREGDGDVCDGAPAGRIWDRRLKLIGFSCPVGGFAGPPGKPRVLPPLCAGSPARPRSDDGDQRAAGAHPAAVAGHPVSLVSVRATGELSDPKRSPTASATSPPCSTRPATRSHPPRSGSPALRTSTPSPALPAAHDRGSRERVDDRQLLTCFPRHFAKIICLCRSPASWCPTAPAVLFRGGGCAAPVGAR